MTRRLPATLLAVGLATAAAAGPASEIVARATSVDDECAYLMRECRLGKAALARPRGWAEHPTGVVVGVTSREATRHVGNAVEAAAAMRVKHRHVPACIAACDALLAR